MKTRKTFLAAACASAFAVSLVGAVAPASAATDPIAGWSLRQQVGAVFMVGAPAAGLTDETMALVRDRSVGGIFLEGRSTAGVEPIAEMVKTYREASTYPETLLVSTDQEGGNVQVLKGPGFSTIPSALAQSHTTTIRLEAETWARELHSAGVNVNLAPTVDLIDRDRIAKDNAPIGYWDRQYGRNSREIQDKGGAFARGMQAGGVIPTLKHFPGLGRVRENTDTNANVTDWVTQPGDESVQTFIAIADRLKAHNPQPWVMMSTAIYNNIDPGTPAAFSPAAVKLLRDAGFTGVITTDDLSNAVQVQAWSPEQRAIRALEAGVDMVLYSANIEDVPAAMDAVFRRAEMIPAFRERIADAARHVAIASKGVTG